MKNLNIVTKTMLISLTFQVILIFIGFSGFFIKLEEKDNILTDVLIMDTIVQAIEALMYLWIFLSISNFSTMVKRRYIDWFITTPIMLLTTIMYMKYNKINEQISEKNKITTFKSFIKSEKENIIKIFIFNALMLLFGYLGEAHIINKNVSIMIGFVLFFLSFNIVYKYIDNNETNKKLFYFVFIVWALYGVAALFNSKTKNICYNFLDIISKNFYGLYILLVIMTIDKNKNKEGQNKTFIQYLRDLIF